MEDMKGMTDIQVGRQAHLNRQTHKIDIMHRHTDRQVGRRTGEQMQTQIETQHRQMHRLQGEQTQIDKQTDYQTDRLRVQTDRQTGADKQTMILNGGEWL